MEYLDVFRIDCQISYEEEILISNNRTIEIEGVSFYLFSTGDKSWNCNGMSFANLRLVKAYILACVISRVVVAFNQLYFPPLSWKKVEVLEIKTVPRGAVVVSFLDMSLSVRAGFRQPLWQLKVAGVSLIKIQNQQPFPDLYEQVGLVVNKLVNEATSSK